MRAEGGSTPAFVRARGATPVPVRAVGVPVRGPPPGFAAAGAARVLRRPSQRGTHLQRSDPMGAVIEIPASRCRAAAAPPARLTTRARQRRARDNETRVPTPLPPNPLATPPAAGNRDVARVALVSRDWGSASRAAMRPAFARLYDPARAGKLLASLGPAGALARLEAHAAEAAALPGTAADVERVQGPVITEAVRAVATEWLIEVGAAWGGDGRTSGPGLQSTRPSRTGAPLRGPRRAAASELLCTEPTPAPPHPRTHPGRQVCWDWKLESTTVFTGVRYLDLWLATTRVGQLSRFQGVAISCLRAAFQRSRDAAGRRDLSRPAAWADVCDGAASAADVSAACRAAARLLRGHAAVRSADTPKLQLRRLWYQLLESGIMNEGRVYGERARGRAPCFADSPRAVAPRRRSRCRRRCCYQMWRLLVCHSRSLCAHSA